MVKRKDTRPRNRNTGDGFTLLEVMIAMLMAMIGLLGTMAIQQTVITSTRNVNDAQVSMRIATQLMEELGARITQQGAVPTDMIAAIADATWAGYPDRNIPVDYMNELGEKQAAPSPAFRFARRLYVEDRGSALPYNISVEVAYSLDSGAPKVVRLDVERRKFW